VALRACARSMEMWRSKQGQFAVVSFPVVYCGGTERGERKWVQPTFSCTCRQKRAVSAGVAPCGGAAGMPESVRHVTTRLTCSRIRNSNEAWEVFSRLRLILERRSGEIPCMSGARDSRIEGRSNRCAGCDPGFRQVFIRLSSQARRLSRHASRYAARALRREGASRRRAALTWRDTLC
jgi:hypothetical protein